MAVFDKLFVIKRWDIGYGFKNISSPQDIQGVTFSLIKSKLNEWYADPFCVSENGNYYIFCEVFHQRTGRGNIGVFEYKKEKFKKCHIVIDEPFHMSYPNVFKHNGRWFMIPETSEKRELRLYEATDFPFKWKLCKVLANNVKYVDSTLLFLSEEKAFIFCYQLCDDANKLLTFEIDMDSYEMTLIDVIKDTDMSLRPGGNFLKNTHFISQMNIHFYGEALIFRKIKDCTLLEKSSVLFCNDFLNFKKRNRYCGVHTFNMGDDFYVVDLLKKSFSIMKPFYFLSRRLIKNGKK